ncbi:MAG: phenylacetate--CoA ligase family protein [Nodularia sp. CChRGM 3473]
MNCKSKNQRAIRAFEDFLSTPLETLLQRHLTTPSPLAALNLFYDVAANVPAYKAFLAAQEIDPTAIQSLEDFQKLPVITKENYISRYPLADLCRYGQLEACDMIAASSGSTGKPTFWPRFFTDELQIATRFEQIFHHSFYADTRRTLAVICFTLGTWVGGMFTTNCCRYLAKFLAAWGFDPVQELTKSDTQHSPRGIYPLPFVYVFGRSNFTVSYFGANIYPENVTVGLEQSGIPAWVTGKFVLQVQEDADKNRFLSVVVELAPGIEGSEDKKQAIASSILSQLLRLNSEFANYVPPEYQLPQVTLAPMGDAEYFPIGVKHRYTRRS